VAQDDSSDRDAGGGSLPRTTENPWRTTGSRVAYETPYVRVREDAVVRPDGKPGTYSVVDVGYPVVVVAALDDQDRVALVRQWRYAWNQDSWELPAGRCEAGEDPLDGARRELLEEAGLHAREWTPLGTLFASAIVGMPFHLFLARGLEPASGPVERDATERDLISQKVPFDQAIHAALDGTMVHAMSAVAVLKVAHQLDRLRTIPAT
jgi:8-oxo-dGTP pyrophosphatase MutT (NUDIX family)